MGLLSFFDRTDESTRKAVGQAAAIRAGFGALAIVAPGPGSKLLGIPEDQDRPAARLFARLFGVRELALAAWILVARENRTRLRNAAAVNCAVDLGDALALLVAASADSDLRRAAAMSLPPALLGAAIWARTYGELS